MDWNWFFSAVAQSTAAVVGILAAFIISKIINSQIEFTKSNEAIRDLINSSRKLSNQFNNFNIIRYNETFYNNAYTILHSSLVNHNIDDARIIYFSLDLSDFEDFDTILKRLKKILKAKKSDSTVIENLSYDDIFDRRFNGFYDLLGIDREKNKELEDKYSNLEIIKKNEFRENVDTLILEIKDQIFKNNEFLVQLNRYPQRSLLINVTLFISLFLFFIGVIYPLSFLPPDIDIELSYSLSNFLNYLFSLSGVILLIVSLFFTTIILIFWRINRSLKYEVSVVNDLKKYSKIQNYSVYLRNYLFNTQLKRFYSNLIFGKKEEES